MNKPKSINWLSPNIIYPELHASLGFGYVVATHEFLPPLWYHIALLIFVVVIILKETVMDVYDSEKDPFFPGGLTDLVFYAVGIGLALSMIHFL